MTTPRFATVSESGDIMAASTLNNGRLHMCRSSLRLRPRAPKCAFAAILLRAVAADERPPTEDTSVTRPALGLTDVSFGWLKSLSPHYARNDLTADTAAESPLFTSDTRRLAQETAPLTTQNGFQAIPKEQRIGIIVGVTVVAVLSAIAVGMCIIDFKRRMRKKRAARLNGRSELDMLENEIRGGRTGHIRPQGTNHRGLWDSLRVVPTKEASRESRLGSSIPADTLQRNVATAASQRDASGVSAGSSTRTRHESDHEWILAYTPRERASIVSSEGSSGLSVTSKPTVKPFLGARTTGQLESEEGRRRDP